MVGQRNEGNQKPQGELEISKKFIASDKLQVNCGADLKPDECHYKILVTHCTVFLFLESLF